MTREDAAFRRKRRLQPAGGPGDKVFPPTYPGPGNTPTHVFETRMIGGRPVVCVLIDSVQSQANRLEEALLNAAEAGRISLPRLYVDFPGAGLNSVPAISSLDAPHRIFDAILRDSLLDGTPFRDSDLGQRLRAAKAHDASAILEASPTALLFGAWNSTGEGGGLGAKFARAIVSEIVGVNVPTEEIIARRRVDGREELWVEVKRPLETAGRRTGSRIDPLGLSKAIPIYQLAGNPNDWTPDPTKAEGGPNRPKLFDRGKGSGKAGAVSKINHGNIAPSVDSLGVTCDYAEQTCVITLAGLRRLRFGDKDADAARTYLAALGLVALAEADAQGYALRSRCDLVCEGEAPLELVAFDGKAKAISLSVEEARALHEEAFAKAKAAGFALDAKPVKLTPQDKLLEIIRRSQAKAMADEGGEAEESAG